MGDRVSISASPALLQPIRVISGRGGEVTTLDESLVCWSVDAERRAGEGRGGASGQNRLRGNRGEN